MNKRANAFLVYLRHFFYIIGLFCLMFLQYKIASIHRDKTFDEFGCIENLQVLILICCFILFIISIITNKKFLPLILIFNSLILLCIFREMDNYFDNVIPVVSWKIAFVFVFIVLGYAMKKKQLLIDDIVEFSTMSSFYLMEGAIFIILPCAQLIGHKPFLANILIKCNSLGAIKELFEESAETLGYFILLCATIEWNINLKVNKKILLKT